MNNDTNNVHDTRKNNLPALYQQNLTIPTESNYTRSPSIHKPPTPPYLVDESLIRIHDLLLVVAPRQQLPHLAPQCLGHPSPHQGGEVARSLLQVLSPLQQHPRPTLKLKIHIELNLKYIYLVHWENKHYLICKQLYNSTPST